jgi:short-subunit dehydrogenase
VVAVLRLTHAALPGMVERGSGFVINISSIAAWAPMGTYSAAKSWVTVFSESLRSELSGTGVSVTAVAPGFTHTEFHERARMRSDSLPEWAWLNAEDVAREALEDARHGRALSVPSHRYQAFSIATRYAPRTLVRRATSLYPRPRIR